MNEAEDYFVFPDPPERGPNDLTTFDQLTLNGSVHHLRQHLGNMETTLVAGERYMSLAVTKDMKGVRYPDLLVAFGVDAKEYRRRNAYVISDQGKPPDFVLEIASRGTGRIDVTEKRQDYAALGIAEYWRFDETGEFHGARLAGDRLDDGVYVPIEIEELPDGSLQGYSEVLGLRLRWEEGMLGWHDPATGKHIATFDDEREARVSAEARVRELEEQLRRLGQ